MHLNHDQNCSLRGKERETRVNGMAARSNAAAATSLLSPLVRSSPALIRQTRPQSHIHAVRATPR